MVSSESTRSTPPATDEGYYWVILGRNPPEIAFWQGVNGGSAATLGPARSTR